MNTAEFLTISAAIVPERQAIIFEGKTTTFGEMNERTNRLANALAGLGVKKGDRVALLHVNTPACIEAYFAVSKLGAIYVPLNYRAKGDELEYMINFAEVHTLLVGDRYIELINPLRPQLSTVKNYISIDSKRADMLNYEELIASASADEVIPDIEEEDCTIIMFTAGTTGRPKGAMLAIKNFTTYILENVTPADPELDERNILTVPLYHIAGTQAMMAAIYGGRTLVLERQFNAVEWMELVEKQKANRAMMVPTMLVQLMDHPEFSKHDLSSLKVITYGAAPMPITAIKKAIKLFPGVSFINAFGQTETASTITMLSPEDHIIPENLSEAEMEKRLKRLTSIGKPVANVEMKVIDESGNEVGTGVIGEILARGPRVMAGYWKDAEKTAKAIDKDGWLHTNDIGYRDEAGYYYLAGRATDMIKRGGEQISPEEVELVLQEHPAIGEVAIIGVPDEEWGEVPIACVVLKESVACTADEITEFCRAKLASYKRPRSVVFCQELPRNPMGKILKRVLRDQYGKS
ncbi:MAG: long-chain-fatty-acid--CoA ligase [Chloroflexi bacterium]|nr:long-chain-fatty-acid--CoA ligase [Chloroflexota bacterium]